MRRIALIGSNSFLAKAAFNILYEQYIVHRFGRSGSFDTFFSLPDSPILADQLLDFDYIIYCAAGGVQSKVSESIKQTYNLNAFYPISLVQELNRLKFEGRFISFGSYFEAGNWPQIEALNEDQVIGSLQGVPNIYCDSKRILTRYLSHYLPQINHTHLILPTFYGVGENESRLLPTLARSYLNHSVVNLTSGSQIRQYVSINDLMKLILCVINNQDVISGIYNVGSGQVLSVIDVVKRIERLISKRLKVNFGAEQRADVLMPHLELLNKKTYNVYGWTTDSSIEDHFLTYCNNYYNS